MAEQNKKETKEVAKVEDYKTALTTKFAPMGGLIPQTFDQLWRMAQIMASSGLMPKGLQTVQAVFVAVQMGLEVGLSPMQAVQNIAVINGRPSIWGDGGLGLIRGSGLLEEFKEWHEGEGDNLTYYCHVKRKDEPGPAVGQFSVADAKQAGLMPAKPDSVWTKYPQRMLQWRARSWPLRDKFTDVLKGLRIAEEVMDLKEFDNGAYGIASPAGGDFPTFEQETEAFDPQAGIKDFDVKVSEKEDVNLEKLSEYLALCAKSQDGATINDVKASAIRKGFDSFWGFYGDWLKSQKVESEKEEEKEDPIRKDFINLGWKNFKPWVLRHDRAIPNMRLETQTEIRDKWLRMAPENEPYPLDMPKKDIPKDVPPDSMNSYGEGMSQEEVETRAKYIDQMRQMMDAFPNRSAYHEALKELGGYSSMNDVPPEKQDEVLKALSRKLDDLNQ